MKITRNEDIRQQLAERGLKIYELALICKVAPITMYGWMRTPLTDIQRKRITKALEEYDEKHDEVFT